MAPRFRCLGWVVPLTVAVLLAGGGHVRAQTLNEGWNSLESEYRKVRGRFDEFRKGGKVNPDDPNDVRAIDLFAKYHTYQVYLDNLDTKTGRKGIDGAYKDFEKEMEPLLDPRTRQALQPLSEVFRDKIRIHALEVLEFDKAKPIHKVHNARVLAKVAELGEGALADTLAKVLKDPKQNDGVRYYVLRGMGTLLAQTQPMDNTAPLLSKDEQARCAEAIIAFLEQRKGPSKNAPQEEIDGFRLLRREAIHALSQLHVPAVNDKVRPALILARFAGNDERFQPPPRIDERVEAAIGLARMQSAQDKRYQPDYAAGQIAKCLGAFGQMVKNERATIKEEKQTRPWKVDAALLKDALAALKTNNEKNAFAVQVADRGTLLLDRVIRRQDLDPNELSWWTSSQSDSPSKELFQGVADSLVKPAPASESETEK